MAIFKHNKQIAVVLGMLAIATLLAIAQQVRAQSEFMPQWFKDAKSTVNEANNANQASVEINAGSNWQGNILGTDMSSATKDGGPGPNKVFFECSTGGIYSLVIQKQSFDTEDHSALTVKVVKQGTTLKEGTTTTPFGIVSLSGQCS